MITAGIDAGGECLKTVILGDDRILSSSSLPYGRKSILAVAREGLSEATKNGGVPSNVIEEIGVTGEEKEAVSFAHKQILEAICCVQGATWLFPSTRTVIDLGANKCLVAKCEKGGLIRTARNTTCAAGTSRYLKAVSNVLQIGEEEAGRLSLQSHKAADIKSTCTVFVESEIISLIHEEQARREDILRGAFMGLARNIYSLLLKVSYEKDVTMIGGVARNIGITNALEGQIGYSILIPEEPIIVGALGAAIAAREDAN